MRRTMVACCGPQVPLDVDEAALVAVQHLGLGMEWEVGATVSGTWIGRA